MSAASVIAPQTGVQNRAGWYARSRARESGSPAAPVKFRVRNTADSAFITSEVTRT